MIQFIIDALSLTSDEAKGIVVLSVIFGGFCVLCLAALACSQPWRGEK